MDDDTEEAGCGIALIEMALAFVGAAVVALSGPPPLAPISPAPGPVAETAAVGPLPDLQPALPAPAVLVSPTPSAEPTPQPTPTPSAAPSEQPTAQPTSQPTPQPTHAPTPTPTHAPTPPPCTESFDSTITYNDSAGSHSLTSSSGNWSYNAAQPGHSASARINNFHTCNGDHFVFTITDNAGNTSCNLSMNPPLTTPASQYTFTPNNSNVTITGRFGSGC